MAWGCTEAALQLEVDGGLNLSFSSISSSDISTFTWCWNGDIFRRCDFMSDVILVAGMTPGCSSVAELQVIVVGGLLIMP